MKNKGFTLVEVIVVMAVIGILVSIIVPSYKHHVKRAREAVLQENLFHIRDAIAKFYSDKNNYPTALEDLVTFRYLKKIPTDPVAKKREWELIYFEPEEMEDFDPEIFESIIDVRSMAEGTTVDGIAYKEL
ncbi:MAG: prepilin-type N-terminal cleavage/methylation domain-containing protein [Candidatus Aminicenantes bacterium]|nr:prepilin-type N-terminal cleavage/methylation domain-containing protein [Candidatus Aminicenantes bacterium]